MNSIQNTLRAIFPSKSLTTTGSSSVILERDKGATFTCLSWTGGHFMTIQPEVAKDMTGFFSSYGAPQVFLKDCDGITMFETEDHRYLYLSELKSSFDTKRICEAKTQLFSTFLKLNMLLTLTPGWRVEKTIVKGFIVSPAPADSAKAAEWKRDWQKSEHSARRGRYTDTIFCGKLLWHHERGRALELRPEESYHLGPCRIGERGIFPKISLHFIEVPAGQASLTLDANAYR